MVPMLEFTFEARIKVAAPHELGETPQGRRRVIPILGGTFAGPNVKGEVLPGGADWQILREDGVTDLTARYLLRSADGAVIAVDNHGLRHGPPEVMARLLRGEQVDPALIYFRTTPRFETSSERYRFLNRHIFVGAGERAPEEVVIRVFQVL